MKMKKLLSLILSVVIMIMPLQAFASDEQAESNDASLLLLNSLGIIDYDEYDDEEVTRAEFIDMVVKAMGYHENGVPVFDGKAYFTDIDTDDEYFESVGSAVILGLVSGYENGRFYPYGPMKTEHAIGVAIKGLTSGFYNQMRDTYYPKICRGVEGIENLNKKNAVKIVMNMLLSNILEHYDVDNVEMSSSTMLEDVFSVYKIKGILNGNDAVSLYGKSVGIKDNVLIGDIQAYTQDVSVYDYIGYEVEGFVRDKDDEKELLCFMPTSKNNVTYIDAKDIFTTTTIRRIDYNTGKKDKSIDISAADVIYNNERLTTYSASDFKPLYGTVTVVDNNNDSKNDVVIVKSYTNYVVDSVNSTSKKIYFKYGRTELDVSEDKLLLLDSEGEEVPYMSLKEFDVLAVYKGQTQNSDTVVFAELADEESVTGQISGMVNRDGKTVIKVDKKEYQMDAGYMTYSATNPKEAPVPKIGMKSTFYLSKNGDVAAISLNTSNGTHYGYMTRVKYDSVDDKLHFTIFTETGKLEKFEVFEKIRYNGTKEDVSAVWGYINGDTTGDLWNTTYNKFQPQLVKYEIRGGLLRGFEVSSTNLLNEFNKIPMDSGGYISRRNVRILHSDADRSTKYFWDDDTKIMRAPEFKGEEFTDEDFAHLTGADILADTRYYMEFYNVDPRTNYVGNIVIVSAAISNWSLGNQTNFVITKVTEEINQNDMPSHAIEGYDQNGVKHTYYMKDNKNYVAISNLKAGDIVGLFADSNNEVISLRKIFTTTPKSLDTMTGTENVKGHVAYAGTYTKQSLLTDGIFMEDDFSGYFSIYGTTVAKVGKQVVVKSYAKDSSGDPTTETVSPLTTEHNSPVIVVDYTGRNIAVTKGTASDIRSSGGEVLAITKQYYPNVIYVIYR